MPLDGEVDEHCCPGGEHETDKGRHKESGLLGKRRINIGLQFSEIGSKAVLQYLEVVFVGEMVSAVGEEALHECLNGLGA